MLLREGVGNSVYFSSYELCKQVRPYTLTFSVLVGLCEATGLRTAMFQGPLKNEAYTWALLTYMIAVL